jgi:hypothetical protein
MTNPWVLLAIWRQWRSPVNGTTGLPVLEVDAVLLRW